VFENHGREYAFSGKQYADYSQQKERFEVASPDHPGQFDVIMYVWNFGPKKTPHGS
jgi:hypothetical protein